MFVPFARLLRMWDERPEDFDEYEVHSLHWVFKWMSSGMLDQPHVPLASIEKWLGEMEHRYRLAGHSERAVRSAEFSVAAHLGDLARAERAYAAWLAADRDDMADCHACELHGQGWWQAERGRDAEALRLWAPVLEGEFTCAHEPHTVLASSLTPLLRLGRTDEARAHHLRGFRLVRGMESMRGAYADHVEFCALTRQRGAGPGAARGATGVLHGHRAAAQQAGLPQRGDTAHGAPRRDRPRRPAGARTGRPDVDGTRTRRTHACGGPRPGRPFRRAKRHLVRQRPGTRAYGAAPPGGPAAARGAYDGPPALRAHGAGAGRRDRERAGPAGPAGRGTPDVGHPAAERHGGLGGGRARRRGRRAGRPRPRGDRRPRGDGPGPGGRRTVRTGRRAVRGGGRPRRGTGGTHACGVRTRSDGRVDEALAAVAEPYDGVLALYAEDAHRRTADGVRADGAGADPDAAGPGRRRTGGWDGWRNGCSPTPRRAVRELLPWSAGTPGTTCGLAARGAEAQAMLAELAMRRGDLEGAVDLFGRADGRLRGGRTAVVRGGVRGAAGGAGPSPGRHRRERSGRCGRPWSTAEPHLEAVGRAQLHLQLAEVLGGRGLFVGGRGARPGGGALGRRGGRGPDATAPGPGSSSAGSCCAGPVGRGRGGAGVGAARPETPRRTATGRSSRRSGGSATV